MPSILIVDDDDSIRALLRFALEGEGYDVSEAVNGRQGLAMYGERLPDLVITDIAMPEMNGLDMMLQLNRTFSNVKVIAMSGEAINLVVAKQFGASGTLLKPLSLEVLLRMIREELAR